MDPFLVLGIKIMKDMLFEEYRMIKGKTKCLILLQTSLPVRAVLKETFSISNIAKLPTMHQLYDLHHGSVERIALCIQIYLDQRQLHTSGQ